MSTRSTAGCRRHDHVRAAYVNAALVIKECDKRRAENMLLRENVPRAVIARVLLTGQPVRRVTMLLDAAI